jgi:hypothetical protein
MNHCNDLHDLASPFPSRLPVYGAQRPGWDFTSTHIDCDATRPDRMLVLDVVARPFPRDNPTLLPEPGRDIPGLVRVVGPAHDGPSLLMCMQYTQQMNPSILECVSVCICFQAKYRSPFGDDARLEAGVRQIDCDLNISIDYMAKPC